MSTPTSLQRLLSHLPHEMFNREPMQELALRLRNEHGLRWSVRSRVLRVFSPETFDYYDGQARWDGSGSFGAAEWGYQLEAFTLGELAAQLRLDGHEVVYESAQLSHISAMALIEGEGDQEQSNGDHLYAYKALLWSVMGAYAGEIDGLETAVDSALRQMVMTDAEGEILDLWTSIFGVKPKENETDEKQIARFYREVLRPKNTRKAIERAVREETGQRVRIAEPWREIFTLNESALSGTHKLHDGKFYTSHVVQVVADEGVNLDGVMDVVHRNVAAGIDVVTLQRQFKTRYTQAMPDGAAVTWSTHAVMASSAMAGSTQALGELRLDGDEGEIANHPVLQTVNRALLQQPEMAYDSGLWGGASAPPGNHPDAAHVGLRLRSPFGPVKTFSMACVAPSNGVPFGDENHIFGGGFESFDPEDAMRLSESAVLSGAPMPKRKEVIDQVVLHVQGWLVQALPVGAVQWAMREESAI